MGDLLLWGTNASRLPGPVADHADRIRTRPNMSEMPYAHAGGTNTITMRSRLFQTSFRKSNGFTNCDPPQNFRE